MGQFRRWRVLSVLLLVLLLCTCPITGQLSQCGMNCMIAASGSVETFCSGAFKNAESMRAPYFSCAVPAQCPDLADIVKLEADLLEHCTVYLEENRHRIGLFFFGTDLLFLVKETRDLVFGAIHILFIVVFVPIYIVHRKERMVRHKDWKMSVIVATTLVIFSVLNMFYYTCFEDLRNLDPIRIRIWASLQILSLTLSMCGLHALIIVHYLQAKVQALRVQLQTEIPVIFQYRGGEITDFAEEARQQRKSGDVQSNSVSIGARGSSIKGGRRESDEEAMRHGGESSHYCGTIVESFPGPETSPALGEISEEHHAADHAADGIARSKASRQFADSMSLTPQPIIYATQESVAQTAERLRRAIYWARPHMAWVYFIVCGIPAWGLNVYGVVYAYEKGDIIKYLAYVAMYQVGLADVLLLILGIPWLPRDK
ncbi:hypothetical protein DFJ77DRAFT_324992 [Powellomyces hirtus]|nr:hypothetical protein DFJ77DRAFT_324992 [Powellomyces hirtus]